MSVNIPRDMTDPFYRYKMPVLQAKVEGRGNGIKTVIVNMADIAKSLERPPTYTTKFFGFELGALTNIDIEKDRFIVNGKHDQETLAKALDNFIERFVLCKKCGRNPETKMVLKNDNIILHCIACGNRSDVDMRHKLASYILKNPTDILGEDGASKSKGKGGKKGRKGAKKGDSSGEEEGDPELPEEPPTTSSRKSSKKAAAAGQDEEEDVEWYTDTSKEAADQRRRQMLDETSELAAKLLSSDVNKTGEEKEEDDKRDPVEVLQEFAKTNPTNEKLTAEIRKVQKKHEWTDEQAAQVACFLLFDASILKQLKDAAKISTLKQFLAEEKAQNGVLAALVMVIGKDEALRKASPNILKTLYDEDILSEEVLIAWHAKKSKGDTAKVKEASTVFVDWLKNAEEESDDDEESDD